MGAFLSRPGSRRRPVVRPPAAGHSPNQAELEALVGSMYLTFERENCDTAGIDKYARAILRFRLAEAGNLPTTLREYRSLYEAARSRQRFLEKHAARLDLAQRTTHYIPFYGDESAECSICIESYQRGEEIYYTDCGHRFHLACFASCIAEVGWTCPVCRQNLNSGSGR